MINDEGWSKWYAHDGMGNPLPIGTWVEVKGVGVHRESCGYEGINTTDFVGWDWKDFGSPCTFNGKDALIARITEYRYKKPKALLDMIKKAKEVEVPKVKLLEHIK